MRGWLHEMVPPEPHSQDLPCRSVLGTGSRLIPEGHILDIKAYERAQKLVLCPEHGQHQKLGDAHALSPAASPEQQHTASHQRVGQQRADGHHIN